MIRTIAPKSSVPVVSRRSALATALAAGASGAVGCTPETDSVPASQGITRSRVFVSQFGVQSDRDGNQNTIALNAAIRHIATQGGGTLTFDQAKDGYTVTGPVVVPSGIGLDLNGQLLRGRRLPNDAMFITGTLSNGEVKANLDSLPETALVIGSSIYNGRIEDCNCIFRFRNFGQGCQISNLVTRNCVQVGRFERCFFLEVDSVFASGFSDPTIPTFHFIDQTNAVTLRRLNTVTAFGLCIEGGASAVIVDGSSFEGGDTAIQLIGDCLGMDFRGSYFEAITGRVFDLRRAGVCSSTWSGNYFHHVNIVFDDGGNASTSTLFGDWCASNYVVTTPNPGFAKLGPARNIMQINGPRNFIQFKAPYGNDVAGKLPANWVTSRNSRVEFETGQTGTSLTDIRARSVVYAGTLARVRSGDTGNPTVGTVPLSRVKTNKGANAAVILDTDIVWRPDSLFAKFVLSIKDDNAVFRVFGDIYGSDVVHHDNSGKRVILSNESGFLRLTIDSFTAITDPAQCTGSLQIV